MEKSAATHWSFLDDVPDGCAVVTQRMEVLFANSSARTLLPDDWFGRRCFEVFPVLDRKCASACPAVRAVRDADHILYCEETVVAPGGAMVRLGVAVIPFAQTREDGARAVLLLRAKADDVDTEAFRAGLEADARKLESRTADLSGGAPLPSEDVRS
jgi:hypothetical protein